MLQIYRLRLRACVRACACVFFSTLSPRLSPKISNPDINQINHRLFYLDIIFNETSTLTETNGRCLHTFFSPQRAIPYSNHMKKNTQT